MAKNNKLINQMRALGISHELEMRHRIAKELTPEFYAAMALALNECFGFGIDRTVRAFEKTREIWENHEGRGKELIKECYIVTGIKLVYNMEDKDE